MKKLLQHLKQSKTWIKISFSDFYLKYRNPNFYKKNLNELAFYRAVLDNKKANLIFDVGANLGIKTAIFSKLSNKVIAFEPSDKMLNILNARFGGNSKVIIVDQALSSNDSVSEFFNIDEMESLSSFSAKHIQNIVKSQYEISSENIKVKKVKTATLDTFIEKYGTPDYIKIDVEGYELEVIKGLSKQVPLISVEVNLPHFLDETIEIINSLSTISQGKYAFNLYTDDKFMPNCFEFLFDTFQTPETVINYLKTTNRLYLELFVKLN